MRDASARKLPLTWEGLYRITAIIGARAYYLEDLDAKPLPQTWNVQKHVPGSLLTTRQVET